jgi:hypothetical protein
VRQFDLLAFAMRGAASACVSSSTMCIIVLYSAYGLLFNEEDDNDDMPDNAILEFCT